MKKQLNKVEQQLYDAALKVCRYYKGEEECPHKGAKDADKAFLWQCEASYCDMQYDAYGNAVFVRYVAEISRAGLGGLHTEVKLSARLVALLYSQYTERYKHTSDGFEEFIKTYYK